MFRSDPNPNGGGGRAAEGYESTRIDGSALHCDSAMLIFFRELAGKLLT